MASIEVSLSTTPRRKKTGSLSGGITSPVTYKNKDYYKEVDALRIALRDKENIIQTLKGELCNTLSNRLALRNRAPPLTEADRKVTEERLHRLRRDADNKRLTIKNLKLALERLDITDNIDIRIQQAELEYRLGREELELLTLREESRALQAALELAETQEKQKNDTIFSCVTGISQMTIHAVEISADPKSPRFGAGPRDNTAGLYVDWAVEDSGLCKGDRILEVNGKLVVGAGRSDLARLLAVAPDEAQIIVLRKSESLTALRTLRSENLRLTHRISYLEEQVRDLLSPVRTEVSVESLPPSSPTSRDHIQVFQKGPQVTALVRNLSGLNVRTPVEIHLNSQNIQNKRSDHSRQLIDTRISRNFDFSSDSYSKLCDRDKTNLMGFQLTRSTASLDCNLSKIQSQLQHRRSTAFDTNTSQLQHKSRRNSHGFHSMEFDSEPTYYCMQDSQSCVSEHSETIYSTQEMKKRPLPPKKPLRLSLHRATSLQSVESAPPSSASTETSSRKSTKRNYRGHVSLEKKDIQSNSEINRHLIDNNLMPQTTKRTPSRAESCQSALRWTSPKSRPHLASISMNKWC